MQRNRTSCYLNLKNYEGAEESIKAAQYHHSSSPQTHFLAFKLALLLDKQENGELHNIVLSNSYVHGGINYSKRVAIILLPSEVQ